MAKKFYTILVLPDATGQAKKIHLPHFVLVIGASAVACLFLFALFVIAQFLGWSSRMVELRHLRAQAEEHHQVLRRVERLEKDLLRVQGLDHSLRVIAGLDQAASEIPPGLGGGAEGQTSVLVAGFSSQARTSLDGLSEELEQLAREIRTREKSLKELQVYLEEKRSLLASTPTIWPVKGWITSGFGYRRSPFTGRRELHDGIDIGAPHGTPVVAAAEGIVTYSGFLGGHGNVVVIEHGYGFTTFYAHNSRNAVSPGRRVKRGEVIAYIGTTGLTTGPHVHYGVQVKKSWVNPRQYIAEPDLPSSGDSLVNQEIEPPQRSLPPGS